MASTIIGEAQHFPGLYILTPYPSALFTRV